MKFIKNCRNVFYLLICSLVISLFVIVTAFAEENIESAKQVKDGVISKMQEKLLKERGATFNAAPLQGRVISLENKFSAFSQKEPINLDLKDIDVPSLLRIISKEGGLNIVVDESVKGIMSVQLKNVSLNDVMHIILTSQELEARVSNNTIFVASRPVMAKKGLNRRFVQTFNLDNANAVYVADILRASIFNKGYKVKDSSSNSISETSSIGQSSLIDAKAITGTVESLEPGADFGDAEKLAGVIKVQYEKFTSQSISIDNNDGGAIVVPDTRTNSILVAGLREDIALAEEAIKYLDKPLKQVSIEVSLIELTANGQKDLGLGLTMQDKTFSWGFNSLASDNDFNYPNYNFHPGTGQAGVLVDTLDKLSQGVNFRIKTLIEQQDAKLLANPNIIAIDGKESLIKITDQVVSKVETTRSTDGTTTYTATLSDVGIVLSILPKIGEDNYISMRVRPSITSPLSEVIIGQITSTLNAIKVTPISTREVIIQDVRVKSGEVLAIAGLLKDNNIEKVQKIPLLGDIPMIGKLFTNTQVDREKKELIILIKPTIIDDIALKENL